MMENKLETNSIIHAGVFSVFFLFMGPQAISASGDMKVNINITLTNCRLESSHKASL